jgi:hypothetical protein
VTDPTPETIPSPASPNAPSLVLLGADDAPVCVDDVCAPASATLDVEPAAPGEGAR